MVFYTVKKQHSSGRNACRAVYPHSRARAVKATLEILEVSLSFLLPFLVMMFCYCRVGIVLGQAATAGVTWWKEMEGISGFDSSGRCVPVDPAPL